MDSAHLKRIGNKHNNTSNNWTRKYQPALAFLPFESQTFDSDKIYQALSLSFSQMNPALNLLLSILTNVEETRETMFDVTEIPHCMEPLEETCFSMDMKRIKGAH